MLKQLGEAFSQILHQDDDMRLIKAAADGEAVNYEKLGQAYWRKYHGTYHAPETWKSMSAGQRDAVYRKRIRLRTLFNSFPRDAQEWVGEMQPPRPDDWPPKRDKSVEWP